MSARQAGRVPGIVKVRLAWFRACERVRDCRWRLAAAALNRIATTEMRHAALLLGRDAAEGYGGGGLLSHLREHETGNEIGWMLAYPTGMDEVLSALESFRLERDVLVGRRVLGPVTA